MNLSVTGNPIADGIATFAFWYVLAPLAAYWGCYYASAFLFELFGIDKALEWVADHIGPEGFETAIILVLTGAILALIVIYPPSMWSKPHSDPPVGRIITKHAVGAPSRLSVRWAWDSEQVLSLAT